MQKSKCTVPAMIDGRRGRREMTDQNLKYQFNGRFKMNTKQGFSTLLVVLITTVVVGVLVGVITYASVASKKDLEIKDLKEQLNQVKEGTQTQVEPGSMNLDTSGTDNQQPTTDNRQTAATPSTNTDETTNWKTYTNIKYGFSFKYPGEWKVTDNNDIISVSITSGQLTYSMIISVEGNSQGLTIDKYVDQAIKTLKEAELQGGPQFRYEERKTVNLGGVDAVWLKKASGLGTILDHYYISRENKVLKIMVYYQASEPILLEPEENSKIANQILSTFQFTK